MTSTYELFHGAPGDAILSIINHGFMQPDEQHKIYYSQRLEDTLQHGGDLKRRAAFAFKANVTIVVGAAIERAPRHGNPLAVIITTVEPLPTQIVELYVRPARATQIQIVKGIESIKAFLA